MDLNAPILGAYCERTSPAFWAEPLNAATSLLVIVVGVTGYALLYRQGRATLMMTVLVALGIAIGLGSFLLHTYGTRWAELADVIPIWAFVAVFGLAVLLRLRPGRAALPLLLVAGGAAFAGGTAMAMGDQMGLIANLSGSLQYIPAALMIVVVVWQLWRRHHPALLPMGLASLLFCAALTFRSLDLPLCETFPSGTHFLWHITNNVVICLLLWAYAADVVRRPA
ncbi:ceramidase domain-containing protein [Limimaricola sp.]|uniref:ceramidase domain-containing protein n=1 Tax=Limimaricola sp. TaxID=2211665 RepID=UPI0025BD6A34|nr:ceramidase domain-containing protein [Limimaricola sp.]